MARPCSMMGKRWAIRSALRRICSGVGAFVVVVGIDHLVVGEEAVDGEIAVLGPHVGHGDRVGDGRMRAEAGGRRKKHIWCRVGVMEISMPRGRRRRSAHSPPQLITTGASMSCVSVRTPTTRWPAVRIDSTRSY